MKGEVGPRAPGAPSLSQRSPLPQAIVTLGAAAGGVLGGWLVDRAGRKLSLLLCSMPFVTGFTVITAAQNLWMLLGGRLLTGLACGVASLVAPVSVFPPQSGVLGRGRKDRTPGLILSLAAAFWVPDTMPLPYSIFLTPPWGLRKSCCFPSLVTDEV